MREVGHLPELYEDARSEKYKKFPKDLFRFAEYRSLLVKLKGTRWVLSTVGFFYYCRSQVVPVDARFLCEKAAVSIAAMKETPCTVN